MITIELMVVNCPVSGQLWPGQLSLADSYLIIESDIFRFSMQPFCLQNSYTHDQWLQASTLLMKHNCLHFAVFLSVL